MSDTVLRAPRSQQLAAALQPILLRHRAWCASFAAGFLMGRFVNAASNPQVSGFGDVLVELFDLARPINVLSWICAFVLVALPLLDVWVKNQKRRGRAEVLLACLAESQTERIIAPFVREGVAWGPDFTLQLAPDLQDGWPLDEVEVRYDGGTFPFPSERKDAYQRFVSTNYESLGFDQDGTKYALVKNPTVFSDAPRLVLEVRKTKFSQVQYYRHNVATVQPERDALLKEAIRVGNIKFPSSLCMHAVVVTRDRCVLATKRSHKVGYSPAAWSVSVEEQLSPDDFRPGVAGVVLRWARRLLFEELAIEHQDYDSNGFRLLSVFLEADTLNCSVCAVLPLEVSSSELDKVLKAKPRRDYEFSDWKMMTYRELAAELRGRKMLQHPSTGYRILLALANRYGASRVANVVFASEGQDAW